ncbi:hypothetical protein [Marinobacter nauticus]|uniref:hypothetical protein n=1 Tax=Marinobacter nauticus TaxID=2743 RepID=UPI000EADDD3D|nr:hypothetical protein [Marinobacter nauticus]RKR79623.1 hypothetical protein C7436_1074 [Marinobacter nauticus]
MASVGYAVGGYVSRRNITPNTLTIEWAIGATTYSLTDDGAGNLTGNGSGEVSYWNGRVFFRPNPAPTPADGDYSISYNEWAATLKKTDSVTPTQASINKTLANQNLTPGSLVVVAKVLRIKESLDYNSYSGSFDDVRKYELEAVAHDDGNGNLRRDGAVVGTIDYVNGTVNFDLRKSYTYQELEQGSGFLSRQWKAGGSTATEEYNTATDITFEYTVTSDPDTAKTKTIAIPGLKIALVPGTPRPVVPGSILFQFAGKLYRDRSGSIITDWSPVTDGGINVGSIDYSTGIVELNDWPASQNLQTAANILSCLVLKGERTSYYSKFRTAGSPLRQGSLIINATTESGEEVSVQAAQDGTITHTAITAGSVDHETGIVSIEWAEAIFPTSLKYSAVAYSYLPLDPGLLGLDPTRLPSDGRVPIFLPGDVGVFSHTIETEVASPIAGATLTFTRDHQAEVWVKGDNGLVLDEAAYTVDRVAGTLTWADPLNLQDDQGQALTTPLTVYDRVEDMVLITDVQVSGLVGFNAQLSQDYPAGEAVLSSAVLHGDLRARVYNLFHQASWTGEWSDSRIGNDTTAKYNEVAYPIEITNQGSIKERWLIRFTNTTSYEIVGETVGVVATGNTSTDTSPVNPATGAPYFTIRQAGWGTGWSAGNSVRFNTDGAQAPFWIARTILSGPATATEDSFATQNRGDAD